MKVELCSDTKATILWSLVILCVTAVLLTGMTYGYIKDRRDQALQQSMVELGYTPMDISCAWNVTQPACLIHAQKETTNDDATH